MSDETPTTVPPVEAEAPPAASPITGPPQSMKLALAIAFVLAAGAAVYYSVKNEQAKDDDIRMQMKRLEQVGGKGGGGKGGG